jgi:threonine dehydrogenase-like Zn-dependent dehydrogenase
MHIMMTALAGASRIIVTDTNEERLKLAESFGAHVLVPFFAGWFS